MKIFNLPDLGEGLPDAEIREWFVKEGDTVTLDQPLAAMETAKAVVDVPSPRAGTIVKLYGKTGDVILTGAPLVEYAEGDNATPKDTANPATAAGTIEVGNTLLDEPAAGIKPTASSAGVQVIPAVRKLAEKLNVDLTQIVGTGPAGRITAADVQKAKGAGATPAVNTQHATTPFTNGEPLRGVRRAMAQTMAQSHAQIVPVTLVDDADIGNWKEGADITLRVIRAIAAGIAIQPELNAWFDTASMTRQLHAKIDLGIAMDSGDGLFVPVVRDIANTKPEKQRDIINTFKQQVGDRSIPQSDLQGATIVLSNFGMFAGRYANPVILPPCVAIIGTGKIAAQVVAAENKPVVHKVLPLSLTVDHRVITGGEAARFLKAVIDDLQLID